MCFKGCLSAPLAFQGCSYSSDSSLYLVTGPYLQTGLGAEVFLYLKGAEGTELWVPFSLGG